MTRGVFVAVACLSVPAVGGQQQIATFKVSTEVVQVSVSVKKGNNPVSGLTAGDFRLYDNGTPQRIEAISVEAVPADVTLFLDTSGSTAQVLGEMGRAVRKIAEMLRPGDRFRVLTIGLSVYNPVPWMAGGGPFDLELIPVAGVSLIRDAVFASLAHPVPAGRRHLVIALTDGEDSCSIVTPDGIRSAADYSEAVLHWVEMSGRVPLAREAVPAWCATVVDLDTRPLSDAVSRTGGEVHRGDPIKAFTRVFEEFRQSYVLRYSPEGVERSGWHRLRVEMMTGRYTVRARPGYSGG